MLWSAMMQRKKNLSFPKSRGATPLLERIGGHSPIAASGIASLLLLTCFSFTPLDATTTQNDTLGMVWEPAREISEDQVGTEMQNYPSIAAHGGRVHVVWQQFDGETGIFYRYHDGTTWDNVGRMTSPAGIPDRTDPSVAGEGNIAYVVWYDWRPPAGADIVYRYYDGASWWTEGVVAQTAGQAQGDTTLAVDGNRAYVAWEVLGGSGYDIFYSYYDGSWQPQQLISNDSVSDFQWHPSIAADGGKVHVVWADGGVSATDVCYRFHNGTSWQPAQKITAVDDSVNQNMPSIAVKGVEVHVVWVDSADGDPDIYYKLYNGTDWQPAVQISTDSGTERQDYPEIALEGNRIHVAWQDYEDGDSDIFYRYYNGTDWQPEIEVSSDIGGENQLIPAIAAENGIVHIIWVDEGGGNMDIYYRRAIIDATPPNSNARIPSGYWQSTPGFDVEWAATDNYSLANISLKYRYSPDNSSWSSWNEWAWNNSISGTSDSGSFSFHTDFDGYYEYYTIARDSGGNGEGPPLTPDAIAAVATIPRPPTNLSARLWGADLEHLYLEWNISLDDGGGRKNVVAYQVFKQTIFNPGGVGYAPQGFHPAPYHFEVDNWTGEGDPNDYFYYVCVYTNFSQSSCTINQAAKFTRTLSKGPNLVSIPLIQSQAEIETVLQTVKFDEAWAHNSSSKDWMSYVTYKPYRGDLMMIDHKEGLWVNVTSPCNLTVAGIVPWTTQIQLSAGWNLVGYPSFNASYTVSVLKTDTGAARVEGFNPSTPPYFLNIMSNGDTLETGYGYWMYSQNDGAWTIQNS
jgi:Fe-S cluster biogenesis protein NfuA